MNFQQTQLQHRGPHTFRKLKGLSYDDVLLVPKKGVLDSRKEANISGALVEDIEISVPIVAAPMTSVVNAAVAEAMYMAGGFSFLHRFNTPKEQAEEFQKATVNNLANRDLVCGIAFGLQDAQERIELLYESGCKIFLLDVAHAHTLGVLNTIAGLTFPDDAKLVVGSLATGEAAYEYCQMGVHGLRDAIGPGAACITPELTCFGMTLQFAIM